MVFKNFLFHRVSDKEDRLWPPMKPSLFEEIVRWLKKEHHVMALEELLNQQHSLKSLPTKIVTISFDDGYKDNIEYAAPILEKYHCPASFYVVTNCINKNIPTWTFLIDWTIQHTEKEYIDLSFDFTPVQFRKIVLPKLKAQRSSIKLKPWLKTLPNHQRVMITDSILEQCNDVAEPNDMMMSWEEIRQLNNRGFYIGSHSHTHPMLANMVSDEEIKTELNLSSQFILNETGVRPQTISYPIGNYDQRVITLSKACGYSWGLAVNQQFFNYREDKLMEIPRIELYQESWLKVRLRISGVITMVKNIWV